MKLIKVNRSTQFLIVILAIASVSAFGYLLSGIIGYKVVAFMLLVTVSLLAMIFDILPVLLSAVLSALIWDFFFIPPHFTFRAGSTEDSFMLLSYFAIALVSAVLTYKIRQIEKEARTKEERANSVKLYGALFNSLSHELKTPISTIIGASDSLLNNGNKISETNKMKLLSEINTASLRLNQQVENLLNMSRLESGYIQVKKDWCDVNEMIYLVVNRIEENFKNHLIVINANEELPLCKLDAGLMEQALYNLVQNAVLYTPEKSTITIEATCESDNLSIMVSDEGIGFPEEEKERIFDKFYRLDTSKPGGTGLGLSIVKGFVEAHNGTVELKKMNKKGSQFHISIPVETSYLNNLKNE